MATRNRNVANARLLGYSKSMLSTILSGKAKPGGRMMAKIEALTGGQVRASDFCEPAPPRAMEDE